MKHGGSVAAAALRPITSAIVSILSDVCPLEVYSRVVTVGLGVFGFSGILPVGSRDHSVRLINGQLGAPKQEPP